MKFLLRSKRDSLNNVPFVYSIEISCVFHIAITLKWTNRYFILLGISRSSWTLKWN